MADWLWLCGPISDLGDGVILVVFLLLQNGKLSSKSQYYLWGNLIGSFFVLFDMIVNFSVAQCFVQSGWLGVSAYSLYRVYKKRWQRAAKAKAQATASLPVVSCPSK